MTVVEKTDTHQELMLRLTTRLVHLCIERRHPAAADPAALITKTYQAMQMASTEPAVPLRLGTLKWKPPLKRKKSPAAR